MERAGVFPPLKTSARLPLTEIEVTGTPEEPDAEEAEMRPSVTHDPDAPVFNEIFDEVYGHDERED